MKTKELIKQADEAYYQARYDIAIELYQKVLEASSKNKHAQAQLRKAEFKLSLKSPFLNIPAEAQELYRRSRSFITAGDLRQAKKLLKEAILTAEKNGVKFPQAQQLLDNLPDAHTAEEYKKTAIEQLAEGKWAAAAENLDTANNLDPTDDTSQTLLTHLKGLIKAKGLVSQLNAGVQDKKKKYTIITEIQAIIDATNELPVLSALWQEVVRDFGEQNKKTNGVENLFRILAWSFIASITILVLILSAIYLLPRSFSEVNCSSINGLQMAINYPNYVSNGDDEKIEITVRNTSNTLVSGSVLLNFSGNSSVHIKDKGSNILEFEELAFSGQKSTTIHFTINEPLKLITNPGKYIDFSTALEGNNNTCTSDIFHISVSPIYSLRKLVLFLWGTIGVTLIGLFWERIKEKIGLSKPK